MGVRGVRVWGGGVGGCGRLEEGREGLKSFLQTRVT